MYCFKICFGLAGIKFHIFYRLQITFFIVLLRFFTSFLLCLVVVKSLNNLRAERLNNFVNKHNFHVIHAGVIIEEIIKNRVQY